MRNWRTMAVFLGPRQTIAEEREGRSRARDIACREPIVSPPSWLVFAAVTGGGAVCPFVTAAISVDGIVATSPS